MNNIQKYRNQVRLTQRQLGEAAGFGAKQQSRIGNYETGDREPSLDDCRALVAALSAAGAVNESGDPVMLDDVFPPSVEEHPKPDTAAA